MNLREHSLNQSNSFIAGWYIDPALCDDFIDIYKLSNNVVDRSDTYFGYKVIFNFFSELPDYLTEYYVNYLNTIIENYKQIYRYCDIHHERWNLDLKINCQKYEPLKSYDVYHYENDGKYNSVTHSHRRHLVFMTYLNTISDGGETEFLYQQVAIKPEKGLTLVWPAHWTHTHRGMPSNKEKYIVTGYYNYCV